jgi:hypothetical protein
MPTVQLDENLIRALRPAKDSSKLSDAERIAINLFRRKKPDAIPTHILLKVFNVSKNTIYYAALTGDKKAYPKSRANQARRINAIVDRLGWDEAYAQYVTDDMVAAVNAAMARAVAAKARS